MAAPKHVGCWKHWLEKAKNKWQIALIFRAFCPQAARHAPFRDG
jgi:hypothetical protein